MRALLTFFAVWVLAPAPLWAIQGSTPSPKTAVAPQGQPATQGQPAPGTAPAAKPSATPPAGPTENYSYDPAGRRDPFLDLLSTGREPRVVSSRRGEGMAGLSVGDISVRGVMQSRGGFYAMVQGPDGKTYMMHPGDKLLDGTVKTVNAEGLVIVQEVNDPLSLVKQREISKRLRSLEAKE
jgi:Tfp pilus assembly protein PilP